jgi:hypothetical protein
MPLKLHELIKKAESKGITASNTKSKLQSTTTRPWQEESILFNNNDTTTTEPLNKQQTDNEGATKRKPTGNKPATRSRTNQQQSDNKNQNGNKPAIISTTKAATYQQQIDNISATEISLTTLVGLQRALLMFIYYECKKARSKSTKSLTLEYISGTLKSSKGSIKTTLQRIEAKGFIKRTNFKIGRGGWSQYSISDVLFQELLQHETDNNLTTNWKTTDNKMTAELAILPPVVSSSLNNTTTNLPQEIQQIDYMPLTEIGFNETHIIQIYREHMKKPELALSAKIIQDSINALAYDLKHNNVANDFKHSPAVVLTSLLKKGMPYSSKTPDKFVTPQEEAMQNYLVSKERQRLARQETEHKIKNLEYQEWQDSLTEEELLELCPESEVAEGIPEKIRLTMRRRKALDISKDYFDAEIWPAKKKEAMAAVGSI